MATVVDVKGLGDSGVQVPEIGIGTYRYTGGEAPLRRSVELGACLVDTAEMYGNEEQIGSAIEAFRSQVFLAAKVSPRNFRHGDVIRSAEESLRRLRTDHIDLYQPHWPSDRIPVEETMGAIEDLVDQGKVRFIGVCNFPVRLLKRAMASLRRGRIVSNQVSYSLVDRTIEDGLLPFCRENGITVIAYSPLGRGPSRLAERDRAGVLAAVAREAGKTPAQVALNWSVRDPRVVAIPKSDCVPHVEENCFASGWRLSPDQVRRLESAFRLKGKIERTLRRTARRIVDRLRPQP